MPSITKILVFTKLPFNVCSFCHINTGIITAVTDLMLFCRKQQQKPWLRWRGIRLSKMAAFSWWSYWLSCMCQECGSNSTQMTHIAGFVVSIIYSLCILLLIFNDSTVFGIR